MDSAAPDSAAPLALTFWTRTDTSLSGYLMATAPLDASGSAFLWHEDNLLKIVSVSANRDTVLWTSSQSGETIGGKYEMIGGSRTGKTGTWKAHLAWGPPATPEMLPGKANVLMVWPLFCVLAAVMTGSYWVRAAPQLSGVRPVDPAKAGISGWMALFVFGQVVGFVMLTIRLPNVFMPLVDGTWEVASAIRGMQPLLVLEKSMGVAQPLLAPIGLYLIFTRKRYAPRFWFAYLVAVGLYALIDFAGARWMHQQSTQILGPTPEFSDPEQERTGTIANLRTIAFALIWGLYWNSSILVKARFGQTALEKPV